MASLEEIGAALKGARESLGISLEDVANRTRISLRHLRAIETGDKDSLPEVFYVRGFLKKYAEIVGLSPNEVADAFQTAPKIVPTTPDAAFTLGPIAYYMAILVGVAGILALAWHFQPQLSVAPLPSPSPEASPSPARAASPASEFGPLIEPSASAAQTDNPATNATSQTPAPPDAAVPTESAPSSKTPVMVGISLSERSWVRIQVNGKEVYAGLLMVGEQKRFTGQTISVTAGNAGGVEMSVNGHPQGPLGAKGKVVTHVYSAANAK